jgi:hypothetical protein
MTEAEEDMLRTDKDKDGNPIFTGLTFEESMEMMTYCGTLAGLKKRFDSLNAKHEAAFEKRKLQLSNVTPLKRGFF